MSTESPDDPRAPVPKAGAAKARPPQIGVKVHDADPTHFHFFSHDGRDPTPTQRGVVKQYEAAASQFRILLLSNDRKEEYDRVFRLLLSSAQGTLSRGGAQADAADDIENLKQETAQRVGLGLRNAYIKGFLLWAAGLSVILFAISVAGAYALDEARPNEEHRGWAFGAALAGVCWGICLGSVVKNLRAPSLDLLVNNMLVAPVVRLVVFGGFAVVFVLLFHSKVVIAGFGPYTTAQILDTPVMALLMGFGLGLLHLVLPARLEQKARLLLGYDKTPAASE